MDSCLGDEFWAEAVNTAVYLDARSLSRTIGGLTPHEKLFCVKAELGHLRRIGCSAYTLIPEAQRRSKFSERAKKSVFLGYDHETVKIWRLGDPESKRGIHASDVRFAEEEIMGERQVSNGQDLGILRSGIPDMILEEDNLETAPIEDVIWVIAPNTRTDVISTNRYEAIESNAAGSKSCTSQPEDQMMAGTPDVSDISPGDPPAPVLRRSGRHGHSAPAHKAMLGPGASN